MRNKKTRKLVNVWAVVPYDFEYKVQYCDSKREADDMIENMFKGAASCHEQEQFEDIVEDKRCSTARYGWKLL